MKPPLPPAELGLRLQELRSLIDDVAHDYVQVYEHGYRQGRRGETTGRPTGDSDPTGALAAGLFEGTEEVEGERRDLSLQEQREARRPAWRHRIAQQALLDVEENLRDMLGKAKASRQALFRPYREHGPRDPIKRPAPKYDGALGSEEKERLEELARQRRARGEE